MVEAKKHRRRTGVAAARAMPARYQKMVTAIEDGTFTLDMLDEEEIIRGRLRNAAGDWRGRPPYMIPQKMAVELVRRQQEILKEKLGPLANESVDALNAIVKGRTTTVHDGPLIQAIKLGLEYGLGKPVEKISIQGDVRVTMYDNVIEASTVELESKVEDEL